MCTVDNVNAQKLKGKISAVIKKMSHGWKIVDGRAVQGLSVPSMMGADSVIHQLIYIHGSMCELALFYLFKALALSLSSSPQLKMSLAFCITFWWTVGVFFNVYTTKVLPNFDVVSQTEPCLQVFDGAWLIEFKGVV